jgi:hypothetical protein
MPQCLTGQRNDLPLPAGNSRLRPGRTLLFIVLSDLSTRIAECAVALLTKKNLILVLSNKRYDPRDFTNIGTRIARRAEDVEVYAVTAGSPPSILDAEAWNRPTLTVALSTAGAFSPVRGPLLIGRKVEKLQQVEALRGAGVSVPPVQPFEPGMKLDPSIWGQYVLLKPVPLEASSHGEGIQLFRAVRLEQMERADFPEQHPIHRYPMMVQKFIDTGDYPCKYRALMLCGEPIYVQHTTLSSRRPDLSATDEALAGAVVATGSGERTYQHLDYPDVFDFAKRMAAVFPDIPLLGCDIIKDIGTGVLYGLEVNPNGNVWHFSSPMWARRRKQLPEVAAAMHSQFGAFDVAANALIRAARELAA